MDTLGGSALYKMMALLSAAGVILAMVIRRNRRMMTMR
jgi:uncharacterized membrane protein affecting hemolysin expression